MINLYKELQLGPIGSLTSLPQLFEPDGIHPNFDGKYFIACLFAAVVYDIDPRGLPMVKAGPYNNSIVIQEDVLRAKLQDIAYHTACSYPHSGYDNPSCDLVSTFEKHNETKIKVWPNPVKDK